MFRLHWYAITFKRKTVSHAFNHEKALFCEKSFESQMQHVGHAVAWKKSATLPPSSVLEDCCVAGDLGSSAACVGTARRRILAPFGACQVFDKFAKIVRTCTSACVLLKS